MKQKKLLMLGGGFLQTFVIQKAKDLGYYVYVLDANPKAAGFEFADEYGVINITDEEACLSYAIKHAIDGVLTAATDYGVLSMSRIAGEMRLPGICYDVAKIIKNKANVRKILYESHADDTDYSVEIHSLDEAIKVKEGIHYPVMVKPCDGSGSRGASRVDCASDFVDACTYAMQGSLTHTVVVEPFITGREYGVESFVDNNCIHILGVMQKEMTQPPYYAELGHAIPSGLSQELEEKVKTCVFKAIQALGINHGSVNMDLLLDANNGVHIVDIGARMGGNLIGSHIIPAATGVDYMGNMIRLAVGDIANWQPTNIKIPVATKLLALSPGKIIDLPDIDMIESKYNVQVIHHLDIGEYINPYRTNLDGCGYVISKSKDIEEAIRVAGNVKKYIDDSIIRG